MNRSLDSVLDSLLADINRDDSSLVGASHVSVVNCQRGDSGSEVLSSQYLLGAEFTRYNNLATGSRMSLEAHGTDVTEFIHARYG